MIKYAAIAFFLSFFLNVYIIYLARNKKLFLTDYLHVGPQTFHQVPTPRIGGLAVFLGITAALLTAFLRKDYFSYRFVFLILSSVPVFFAGFFEDLTGKLKPGFRLIFMTFSACLIYFLLHIRIVRLDIPFLDGLLNYPFFSFIFTIFALVGISNAINIIDGFNGLASMVSMMIFMAIAYVAYKLSDYEVASICIISTFGLLGFFLLNYPFGLIFLGDGGAYFTGFLIGVCSIMLVQKHPEVSPWFAFLVNIYPVYETVFSVYRKKILRKKSAMKPDGIHLHMIFYKIFIKRVLRLREAYQRNPLTSVFLWVLNAFGIVPALLFWEDTRLLILSSLIFVIFYTYLYWKILDLRIRVFKQR